MFADQFWSKLPQLYNITFFGNLVLADCGKRCPTSHSGKKQFFTLVYCRNLCRPKSMLGIRIPVRLDPVPFLLVRSRSLNEPWQFSVSWTPSCCKNRRIWEPWLYIQYMDALLNGL
jgi:hypothetical protein